jgi:hypothetical protein
MSISVLAINPNPTIQATHLSPPPNVNTDVTIFTGTIECVFKGNATGVTRDTLSFNIRDPNTEETDLRIDIFSFFGASGTVSLTSFAYDGVVNDALWAVDSTFVGLINEDRGTGTANVQVGAQLAVRGANGIILRVNYTVFVRTTSGAIVVFLPPPGGG